MLHVWHPVVVLRWLFRCGLQIWLHLFNVTRLGAKIVVFGQHHSAVFQVDVATSKAPIFEQVTAHMKLDIVLEILNISFVIKNIHDGTTPLSLDFSDLPFLTLTTFTQCYSKGVYWKSLSN
ncbi:hypothetical protein E2C01_047846 [Portunus trituberculatus]|uniref:Secreted protein n=1 Tax=Portunus trituberculatus TaxID=210409 RepID=A0A5B7G9L4_PORTR|nr:hypothetical protein [Portunus trituberculatus]